MMKIPCVIFTDTLVYVLGERCVCPDPACKFKNYQASIFLQSWRIFMGRN